jgi:hypothetical protein
MSGIASSAIFFSIAPPPIVPTVEPSSFMSILAQGLPGAEPNDSTTVARTAGVPEFLAAMISSKISIFNSLKKGI